MKHIKYLILPFVLLLSISAHAQAVPKPVPDPIPPTTTPTSINTGTYIDRPYKSANSETYTTKKVPLDKAKMGKWFKKLPKPDMISIGILALGEAVDYVLDPANNTATYNNYAGEKNCYGGGNSGSLYDVMHKIHAHSQKGSYHVRYQQTDIRGSRYYVTVLDGRDYMGIVCSGSQDKTEIPLDELADKIIDAAQKGNPDAKKWVQDWADDEVRTNPNAYPEHQPNPQPNPKDDPQAEPRPKPSPDTNPNTQPQPNPSETIKPCENGYYRVHGFCVPDPAYNPDKDTNPKDNPKPNPRPSDEPSPNPNTDPNPQPNPKDKEQKPFELPAFCSWAKPVCDFIDWVKDNPDLPEPQQVQIDDNQLTKTAQSFDTDYLRFGGQCPAPISHTIAVGNQYSVFNIDLTPLCQFVLLVRPAILAMAYLLAIGIVSNAIKDS